MVDRVEDSRNHILRCLGIRPEDASADDRRLASLLEEAVGQWRWGPAYVEDAKRIVGIETGR